MNPLALLNPTAWLAAIVAVGALFGGVVWWGHTKYQAGVDDTSRAYKAKADEEIAAQEATRKIQFRQAEVSQKTFDTTVAAVKEDRREKRDPVLADLKRDNDLLQWAVARRGEALAAATDTACVAERRRIIAVESVLGESQRVAEENAGGLVEGEELVRGFAARIKLAREWAQTRTLGDQ